MGRNAPAPAVGRTAGRTLRARLRTFYAFSPALQISDARENLSVQVHPPERTAAARRGEVKNEVWYVLHADPDALIYGGMEETATLPDIRRAAETGQMEQLIRSTHLEKGEHLYIPAGLVHAIGAGHLIAEIQQNSDTTYRLYDWNRTDASGQGRELHMEQALDSIAEFRELCRQPGYLTEMPHFTTEEYRLDQGERFTQPDASRFSIFTVLRGPGSGWKRRGRENSSCLRQMRTPSPPWNRIPFCSQQRFERPNMTKSVKNSAQS